MMAVTDADSVMVLVLLLLLLVRMGTFIMTRPEDAPNQSTTGRLFLLLALLVLLGWLALLRLRGNRALNVAVADVAVQVVDRGGGDAVGQTRLLLRSVGTITDALRTT